MTAPQKVRVDDLIKRLVAAHQGAATLAGRDGLSTPTSIAEWYVRPNINLSGPLEGADVFILDAAGAVGKSVTAEFIAASLRWPLVHAERAQVGSFSLTGMIQDAAGLDSTFFADLAAGRTGVVVDALDEALMRAGFDNFIAYLDNISDLSRAAGGSAPQFVLMARTETADLMEIHFQGTKSMSCRGRLEFLDLDNSKKFVLNYLKRRYEESGKPEYNGARAFPKPFEKLLTSRLSELGKLVSPGSSIHSDWHQIEDFVGYPPVLTAVAESVAVANPSKVASVSAGGGNLRLLQNIVRSILEREQGKVIDALKNKFRAQLLPMSSEYGLDAIYSPAEQMVRLFARVVGEPTVIGMPAMLPSELESAYNESIGGFFDDHPFLRGGSFANLVFSDYVLAEVESDVAHAVIDPGAWSGKVGPFYVRFLGLRGEGNSHLVREGCVSRVLASWHAESDLLSSKGVTLIAGSGEACRIFMHREQGAVDTYSNDSISFEIEDFSGVLEIESPIRSTVVSGDFGVVLSSQSGDLIIGDDVAIKAGVVETDARSITITAGREVPVKIWSRSISANQLRSAGGSQALEVVSSDPPGCLRQFTVATSTEPRFVYFSQYVDLRAILMSFGRSVTGDPSVYGEKLEQAIVKDALPRKMIVSDLMDRGIVYRDGALYKLSLSGLSALGFGLNDVLSGDPSNAVLAYLAGMPSESSEQF